MTHDHPSRTALITGASRGLGRALLDGLVADGWHVVATARTAADLDAAAAPHGDAVTTVTGDITDPSHRTRLAAVVGERLDALIANGGTLGPAPLPRLADVPLDAVADALTTNAVAQLGLVQALLPALRRSRGAVVAITSDAARGAWAGWGAYGASKAALEQLVAVLAVEEPELDVYAIDPGDLRTAMHQAAFPGEDIGDRPLPATAVPAFLDLLGTRPPSGRVVAADLLGPAAGVVTGAVQA